MSQKVKKKSPGMGDDLSNAYNQQNIIKYSYKPIRKNVIPQCKNSRGYD